MAIYEDETPSDRLIYKSIQCHECEKFCGIYFRKNPTFFDELFFCTLACYQKHLEKKNKK